MRSCGKSRNTEIPEGVFLLGSAFPAEHGISPGIPVENKEILPIIVDFQVDRAKSVSDGFPLFRVMPDFRRFFFRKMQKGSGQKQPSVLLTRPLVFCKRLPYAHNVNMRRVFPYAPGENPMPCGFL